VNSIDPSCFLDLDLDLNLNLNLNLAYLLLTQYPLQDPKELGIVGLGTEG
jgi:hypothetical protein